MLIEGNGILITSVQERFDSAPPKGGTWVPGRSARELAEHPQHPSVPVASSL